MEIYLKLCPKKKDYPIAIYVNNNIFLKINEYGWYPHMAYDHLEIFKPIP